MTAVVGNEDGAHKITADLAQALSDVGYSIPAQGGTYWNGEAMSTVDYLGLERSPEAVAGRFIGRRETLARRVVLRAHFFGHTASSSPSAA